MTGRTRPGLAIRLYTLAVYAFPRRLRELYGREMVATFAASHAALLPTGAARARRYTRRAALDALSAGLRERLGRGGAGLPPRRDPRAGRRSRALLHEVAGDLRFAARTLRHSPAFALTVVVVLALGVGINGAIFTAVNAALLAPLPFDDPERLFVLEYTLAEAGTPDQGRAMAWSWPKYQVMAATPELRGDTVAAYAATNLTLSGSGDATRLAAEAITSDYFALLGVALPFGRPFPPENAVPSEIEAILSNGLWLERFDGDRRVIGRRITLNGHAATVVGVAPAGFGGLGGEARLWVQVPAIGTLVSPVRLRSQVHWLQAVARVGEGTPIEQLRGRMARIGAAVDAAFPMDEPGMVAGGAATSLSEARRNPRAQRAVLVIAAAAGLVLLIACVNLAALMLARGSDRRREIAVRLALGSSRTRVARGLALEMLILALAGGVLGLAVTALGINAMVAMWPETFRSGGWNLAFVDPAAFSLNLSTLVYTVGLGLMAGLLFGAGPALRLSHADLGSALKEGDKTGTPHRRSLGRRWLVATEIAVALVLLVGAGLMITSLTRLLAIDTGFNQERLLVFEYSLPRDSAYAENPAAFHDELFERLAALPQVETAAGGVAPLRGYHWSISGVTRAADRTWEEGERKAIGIQTITDDYFATLQTRLLRGRAFDARDQAASAPVIVLSDAAAREFFGDDDPIGQPFALTYGPTADGTPAEVIGVVDDVLYDTREKGIMPEAYFLQRQNPEGDLQAMVRTRGTPFDALPDVRAVLAALEPGMAIHGITTADALAVAQVGDTQLVVRLLVVFSAMATLLAATGVWGLVSYSVVRRRRELGIRMALGARSEEAVGLIVRRGLSNALIGLAAGTAAAIGLARYLGSLLFEVDPGHPAAFAGAAALLFAVSLLAAWLPALRVARVDPAETLRSE